MNGVTSNYFLMPPAKTLNHCEAGDTVSSDFCDRLLKFFVKTAWIAFEMLLKIKWIGVGIEKIK